MNQILQVQEERKRKESKPIDTKKIILFFAVAIIIFGLILLGQGAYNWYKNSSNKKVSPSIVNQTSNANISLEQTEDNKLNISVSSDTAISHIVYNWNNDTSTTLDETGKTNITEIVDIPSGNNTLYISVIDSNGNETKDQKDFYVETSKPIINLSVVGNDIKLSVTSETDLSSITYKWNSDEETVEDMYTYENKTSFEKNIDIPKGQNTLKITATDINGEKTEKSQNIKGIAKPKDPTVRALDGYMEFTATAEENIATVNFEFNGTSYTMDTNTFGETTTVHYKMPMISGMNYLKIVVKTVSGGENTSLWKCDYTPQ